MIELLNTFAIGLGLVSMTLLLWAWALWRVNKELNDRREK